MNRFAHALYCDDIRVEVGNKHTLIGLYHGKMYVSSFPATLPKLCIGVWVITPIDKPFKSLRLKLLSDDKTLVEQNMPDDGLAVQYNSDPKEQDMEQSRVFTVYLALQVSPFFVERPAKLRTRVYTENEELKAGGLSIELPPTSSDAASASPPKST